MRVKFDPHQFKQLALNLSHDELIAAIQKVYPDSVHGRDYIVAHPVEAGSGERIGPAQILAWNLPHDPPDVDKDITPIWREHGQSIRNNIKVRGQRGLRNAKLTEADVLVSKATDSGDAQALAKAVAYRQALRDVTKQPGFPENIDWPPLP